MDLRDIATSRTDVGARATALEPWSVEFLALACVVIFSIVVLSRGKDRIEAKLFFIYIVFLPFTDRVYRVFSLQPVEMVVLVLFMVSIVRFAVSGRPLLLGVYTPYLAFLAALFLLTLTAPGFRGFWEGHQVIFGDEYFMSPSMYQLPPVYNWLYWMRFAVITVGMLLFYQAFTGEGSDALLEKGIRLYVLAGTFAGLVTIVQAALFLGGYGVNGIFYDMGVLRVKGLAHEPTTMGSYLLSSLVLSFSFSRMKGLRVKYGHFLVQLFGMILTVSVTMLTIMVLTIAGMIVASVAMSRRVSSVIPSWKGALVAVLLLIPVVALAGAGDLGLVKDKIDMYLSAYLSPETIPIDPSGKTGVKGADVYFSLKYLGEHPFLGIGFSNFVFTEATATNTYFTILAESGVLGFALFSLWALFFYRRLHIIFRRINGQSEHVLPLYAYIYITLPLTLFFLRVFNFHYIWVMVLFPVVMDSIVKGDKALCASG